LDEKQNRVRLEARFGGGRFSPGMVAGALLIVVGVLIFVDNLEILPFRAVRLFWPVVLICGGLFAGVRATSTAVRVWSGAAVLAGVLMGLREFDIVQIHGNILWPLALIATGVVLLIYRLRWQAFEQRFNIGSSHMSRGSEHVLSEFALFSQVRRRVASPRFEGGELAATFGGIEIDLRHAEIASEDRRAYLAANVLFGSIEIRVPEHWRIAVDGNAVFGQYEDKTIPPRPEPGVLMPVLVLGGGVAFGAVVVMN
jgi:predicted membrane protein